MKPEMMLNSACDAANANEDAAFTKIHVLEPGKDQWDVIRDVANSGVQEEAFYVLDVGDIVRKHKEWKLKLPRVTPFYGNQNVHITWSTSFYVVFSFDTAVKCNDHRTVLETLAALGASFDCASKVKYTG